MPRKPPPVEYRFKPGNCANPSGKPKQLITKDKLRGLLDRYMRMSKQELKDVAENPQTPMLELIIAAAMVKAVTTGDWSAFEGLLQRHLGKVADELVMPQPTIIKRLNGETVELGVARSDEGEAEDEVESE